VTVAEKESTEVATVEQKAAPTELITIEPKKYVALVFEPFKTKLASAIEADAEVMFDITTTAGMAIAVKRRAVFRDDVRLATEAARKFRKAPILEIGKLLDESAKAIIAEAEPFETKYDAAITAEIRRKEAIKLVARKVEEERQAAIQAGIDSIKSYVVTVAGKSSADIDKASLELDFREITLEEFGDRTGEATQAKILTLEKLSEMYDEALAREQEAIRVAAQLEADRIERERVAEANRVESERLAKLAREIEERDAAARAEEEQRNREAAAARAKADKEADDRRAEQDRIAEANRVAAQKVLDGQAATLRAQQEAAAKVLREAREAEEKRLADARAEEERIAREAREEEQRRLDAEAVERRRVEQEAADRERAAEEAAHAAEQKLRDAAPAMLLALQEIVAQVTNPANAEHTLGAFAHGARIADAVAAIAEATV
jgi:hypothetical protein